MQGGANGTGAKDFGNQGGKGIDIPMVSGGWQRVGGQGGLSEEAQPLSYDQIAVVG